MVMDPRVRGFSDTINGLRLDGGGASFSNPDFVNIFKLEDNHTLMDLPRLPPDRILNHLLPSSSSSNSSSELDSPEDCDFSDTVLKYISQMLMEEDMEEKACMFQESSALQAAEKPFYEILGEKYPPSPDRNLLYVDQNPESSVDTVNGYYAHNPTSSCNSCSSNSNSNSNNNTFESNWRSIQNFPVDYQFQTPRSVLTPASSYIVDVSVPGCDLYCESRPVWNFKKGVEEANKFLPNGDNLFIDLNNNVFLPRQPKEESNAFDVKEEKSEDRETSPNGARGKKNLHRDDIDDIELEQGRSNKHSARFVEELLRTDDFDRVLLCTGNQSHNAVVSGLKETLHIGTSKTVQLNGNSKASNGGGKSRGKKQGAATATKKDVVDLRTLLIHCAQAVAADDRRTASELLRQIRQHSSPFGDGTQRLAHCFADGLEARLAGTGSQIYSTLLTKTASAADILKAYQLYLAACPFKKLSNFFSNQTIVNLSENETSVHIVDFGIYYGFQWPCLLQKLANRKGGPPRLRITGIDLPQPGFRPAERVEETGRRLANYAESFGVPFEYTSIAQKWETIQLEDIKIEPGELLVVNCMYRMRTMLDETVVLDSPRNAVLNLIRRMNPAVFIQGIVNGAYSAPFFITRFREALFHYSSLFDVFETNVPREHPERILLERDLFGREALNVIACEGSERVERPETYKQWQIRNMRAGFQPFPLNKEIVKMALDRVKSSYHKDFVIDTDGHWMLQGWKGRIIYGIAAWKPLLDS